MMALSVGREIGVNVKSGDDIASWCMAAMAFLGLAHTFKSGEMIRVGLLTERLTGRTRWLTELFALTMAALFIGYFAWHAVDLVVTSWRINDMSTGVLVVPLWIPQIGFATGLVILFIAIVDELVHVARRQQAALRERAAQDRRRGDRARRPERRVGRERDGPHRHLDPDLGGARRAAGLGRVDRHQPAGLRLARHAVRGRQHSRPAPCSPPRSGATPPTGSWRRCRCSSGWAKSCSAPGCRRRCSADWRRGSGAFPGGCCT